MDPELLLDPTERRIVGVLIEKQYTTPDTYPLSLNALVAGCSQKSNRDPVRSFEPFEIEGALRALYQRHWVTNTNLHGRVLKWKHRTDERLGLDREQLAVLAELLLRGPQQPGELRARAARMAPSLDGLPKLLLALERLGSHDPPLVRNIGRRSGERADRYAHELYPEDEAPPEPAPSAPAAPREASAPPAPALLDLEARIERLEAEVETLKSRLETPPWP